MNDLGKRLNELARSATTGAALNDPSLIAPPQRRSQRGLSRAMALGGIVAVTLMLVLWQGRDAGTTAVAAGQVEGETATTFLGDETCAAEPLLELLRAGVPTYDYNPAGSFDALANQSAAVVVGQVESIARTEVNGSSYIELIVAGVVEVPFESGVDTPRNDITVIAYEARWGDSSSPDPLASPVAVEGLDFFGFLLPWSGVRDGWTPGVEGLYVSCAGPGLAVIENGAGPNDPNNPGQWWAQKAADQAAGQAMADAAAPDALEAARLAAEAARLEAEQAAAAAEAARLRANGESNTAPFLHTVETGDRLGSIAEKYNVTVDVIVRANPQMDPNLIIAGEQLRIPGVAVEAAQERPDGITVFYVVQPGETLGTIANTWTVSVEALLAANPDFDTTMLRVGQELIIPPWGTGLDIASLPTVVGEPGGTPVQHRVVTGDDIAALARLYQVTTSQIVAANDLTNNGNSLEVGQVLVIPPQPPQVALPATPATPEDLEGLQQSIIEIAREQWNRSAVDSYTLRYAEFRPEGPADLVTVIVEDGVIRFLDWDKDDLVGSVYTVDALFDLANSADTVREFEFDQQSGFPTLISVDPDNTVAGDEFAIRSIEVVPTPPTS